MNSPDIFVHHARGSALSANLSGKDVETSVRSIEPQASVALPSIGGSDSSVVEKPFDHPVLTFESARSDVSGEMVSRDPSIYVTKARTTIQGLRIPEVIQAESITARMVVTTIMKDSVGLGPVPTFSFSETSFEDLVINGKSYSLKSGDYFDRVITRMQELYARSRTGVRLATTLSDDPVALHPRASTLNRELLETEGTIDEEKLERSEIQAIRVPRFGDVSISEVLYNPYICQIHMLRIEVDSKEGFTGEITIGAVEGGASCFPGHKT